MTDFGIKALENDILDTKIKLSFKEYILAEAKQSGVLYHFTTLANIENIIKSKKIQKGEQKYVSLTRDFQLPMDKNYFNPDEYIVRISIDGDKLSENIKIIPHNDKDYPDEKEEGILNDISMKYFLRVDFVKNYTYFTSEMIDAVIGNIEEKITTGSYKKWIPYHRIK